ncbi:Bifunctional protein BirA [Budvicia aquatica]|uniref:Bifunctional protein BirA n=1 Tax=Budvicia aquatica TaxID=82979 RepID=A0A484ZF56_9GAMM|nr:Bifunctional protein BirA [Budvicia aquatica]
MEAGSGPAAAIGLSLVIGIVMAEVLHKLGAADVRVKWPNDLYLKDRKLAGILVELTGKTGDAANVVIGAGINLSMREPDSSVVNQLWSNLSDGGIAIDRNQLVATLLSTLRETLQQFEQQGLAPFITRWRKLDNFIDRPVKLLIGENQIHGIARGIDKQGLCYWSRMGWLSLILVVKFHCVRRIELASAKYSWMRIEQGICYEQSAI